MKECHVCLTVCEDDAELCPLCGAELRITEPTDGAESETVESQELKNPVLAVTVEDVITGDIFRDMLTENGIPFSCDSADNSLHVTFGGGFAVENIYVNESDLTRAQELYEEALACEPEFDFDFAESDEETDEEI